MKRNDSIRPRPIPRPRPICGACNGNKGKTVDGTWVACAACQGTGLGGAQ